MKQYYSLPAGYNGFSSRSSLSTKGLCEVVLCSHMIYSEKCSQSLSIGSWKSSIRSLKADLFCSLSDLQGKRTTLCLSTKHSLVKTGVINIGLLQSTLSCRYNQYVTTLVKLIKEETDWLRCTFQLVKSKNSAKRAESGIKTRFKLIQITCFPIIYF